ncbi:IS200/IS605 family transposase [Propionimicrobium lymphophilum]|uniref:IS200/IS605 family transposase n=1 Tax=Propionimicrobium lymphophilum TaxID=33012 RepID=UPI0025510300|nr:IS200/IS605 family transposase [Propionimicrobium lymphophilum]MDK7709408.1 IS200/IS605 family transposase [Propionimicrobium lymphophilum]
MGSTSDNFRSGRHVVYDLHAHIVLTPKYRKKVFTEQVSEEVERSARAVCKNNGVALEEFNTDLDHAHLVVSYPPKISLSKLIGAIKTNTSRHLRNLKLEEVETALWGEHFWSPSYFVSSTGEAPLEKIKKYVQNQSKNPRKPGRPRNSSTP